MMMTTRAFMVGMGFAVLGLCTAGPVRAQASSPSLIRWAVLDIDPAKLDGFKAAAQALKEAVLRTEPGVAVYHAVSEVDNPGRIHVLEMYDDAEAYQVHVRQAHFRDLRGNDQADDQGTPIAGNAFHIPRPEAAVMAAK